MPIAIMDDLLETKSDLIQLSLVMQVIRFRCLLTELGLSSFQLWSL